MNKPLSRAVLSRWGRAAELLSRLAPQPVPEVPSELELEAIELALWDKYRTRDWGGGDFMYVSAFSSALEEYRAVLARRRQP